MHTKEALPIVRKFIDRQLEQEGLEANYSLFVIWVGVVDNSWCVRIRSNMPGRYIYDVRYNRVDKKRTLEIFEQTGPSRRELIKTFDLAELENPKKECFVCEGFVYYDRLRGWCCEGCAIPERHCRCDG